jgi:hypothetical protein
MSAIRREDLLDMLRELERECQKRRALAAKSYPGSTVAHGHFGCADGIEFCIGEIAARFGIEVEETEEGLAPEQSTVARPEKKRAPSKGQQSQERKKKSS